MFAEKYQDWICIYQNKNDQWLKHLFSLKYKVCWKNIKTEAAFTMIKMNNEWNVFSFKIQGVLKKYIDWSCIYQGRNEQGIKCSFIFQNIMCIEKYRHWSSNYQNRN